MAFTIRDGDQYDVEEYVDPTLQLNLGLWFLFGGATLLLVTRIWIKVTRSYLYYDDYILMASWVRACFTNRLLVGEEGEHPLPGVRGQTFGGQRLTMVVS